MKNLLFILIVLYSLNVFGQDSSVEFKVVNDSIQFYWKSGHIKYSRHFTLVEAKNDKGTNLALTYRESFYDKEGKKIPVEVFRNYYGKAELDSVNAHKDILYKQIYNKMKTKHPNLK